MGVEPSEPVPEGCDADVNHYDNLAKAVLPIAIDRRQP
jgi:hypothetical protein